jgi:hypothetical protein
MSIFVKKNHSLPFIPCIAPYITSPVVSPRFANMKIVSFDPGFINMAMVVAEVDPPTQATTVLHCRMYDICEMRCPCDGICGFTRNDNCAAHRVYHYLDAMDSLIVGADKILIENQPPCGIKGVEQSLYFMAKLRYSKGNANLVELVSPRAMHAFFAMSQSKVERRVQIVDICGSYLKHLKEFNDAPEQDHLCDACGFIIYYVANKLETMLDKNRVNRFASFNYEQNNSSMDILTARPTARSTASCSTRPFRG